MPHHGSKENNPDYFLSKVKTSECVISTNGRYHHPSDETLELLRPALQDADDRPRSVEHLRLTYPFKDVRKATHLQGVGERYSHISEDNKCFLFTLGDNCTCEELETSNVMA